MSERQYSKLDDLVIGLDQALRTVFGSPTTTGRPNPARDVAEAQLSESERQTSAALMRVNHAGEVSAQALYQGQALTARLPGVREKLEEAAREESDHLVWCEQRVAELGGRVSYLNPLWYGGSFVIGALAGAAGDRWSLGFLAETEHQVIAHLDRHLQRLPPQDARSSAIVSQMREDEGRHATVALDAGGARLPAPVRGLMALVSKVMTRAAYWI
jgi:ubiquinone biosynthesis monooxygenase Coq7